MDADDLRDYEDQFLDDFSPAKGPIAEFLAYLPGSMDTFQDGLLKAIEGLTMPQPDHYNQASLLQKPSRHVIPG